MFDAYPRQRISYSKVALPLSLVALLCLVLYAVFESGEDARPDSEDPNMKRMRPFLSSQSFEIGLWTRQKGPSASASASGRSSSPEVEELRQELEKARVRTEKQAAELSKLRGSMSAGSKEDLDEALHGEEAPPAPAPVTKTAPASAVNFESFDVYLLPAPWLLRSPRAFGEKLLRRRGHRRRRPRQRRNQRNQKL